MVGNIFACSESPKAKGVCNTVDPLLYGQLVFKNLLAVKGVAGQRNNNVLDVAELSGLNEKVVLLSDLKTEDLVLSEIFMHKAESLRNLKCNKEKIQSPDSNVSRFLLFIYAQFLHYS